MTLVIYVQLNMRFFHTYISQCWWQWGMKKKLESDGWFVIFGVSYFGKIHWTYVCEGRQTWEGARFTQCVCQLINCHGSVT